MRSKSGRHCSSCNMRSVSRQSGPIVPQLFIGQADGSKWRNQSSTTGYERLIINGKPTGITKLFTFMCIQLNYCVSRRSIFPGVVWIWRMAQWTFVWYCRVGVLSVGKRALCVPTKVSKCSLYYTPCDVITVSVWVCEGMETQLHS
jgi:hypothetical protein